MADAKSAQDTLGEMIAEIRTLTREVERLQRDIRLLAARLRAAPEENFLPMEWSTEFGRMMAESYPKNLAAVIIVLTETRRYVRTAEMHLNAIRGHMMAVAENTELSAVYREWLAERSDDK